MTAWGYTWSMSLLHAPGRLVSRGPTVKSLVWLPGGTEDQSITAWGYRGSIYLLHALEADALPLRHQVGPQLGLKSRWIPMVKLHTTADCTYWVSICHRLYSGCCQQCKPGLVHCLQTAGEWRGEPHRSLWSMYHVQNSETYGRCVCMSIMVIVWTACSEQEEMCQKNHYLHFVILHEWIWMLEKSDCSK